MARRHGKRSRNPSRKQSHKVVVRGDVTDYSNVSRCDLCKKVFANVFALSAHRRTEACKRSLEYSMHRLVQIVDVFLPNEYHPDNYGIVFNIYLTNISIHSKTYCMYSKTQKVITIVTNQWQSLICRRNGQQGSSRRVTCQVISNKFKFTLKISFLH